MAAQIVYLSKHPEDDQSQQERGLQSQELKQAKYRKSHDWMSQNSTKHSIKGEHEVSWG